MLKFYTNPIKTLILTIFLTLPLTAFSQYTLTDDDVTVDENGVITECTYDFTVKDLIIPETLDGKTITGIAGGNQFDAPFAGKELSSVTLPQTLISLSSFAFFNNDLESIELPSSLLFIGESAFFYNNSIPIGSITLPQSSTNEYTHWIDENGKTVTNLEDNTLSYTARIEYTLTDADVVVENGVITNCSYSFRGKFITIPEELDGQTVTDIMGNGESNENIGPFIKKDIWEVTIPASVETIHDKAFFDNMIISVNFENNSQLKEIGNYAFTLNKYNLPLQLPTSAKSNFENWIDSYGTEFAPNEEYIYEGVPIFAKIPYTLRSNDLTVENGVITGCSYDFESKFITIPDELDGQTITEIGIISTNGIFSHKGIMGLTLPTTLQKIGRAAFMQNSLKSIDLERCTNLSDIGTYAFYSNELEQITIPSTVTTIGEKAFSYNSNLENISFSNNSYINYIGSNAFSMSYFDPELELPSPLKAGKYFSEWEDGNGNTYPGGTTITDFSSDYTAIFSDTPTSLADAPKIDLEVYPNPVQRILNISSDQLVQIEIIDLSGTVIYKSENQDTTVDFSPFAKGIYFLRANNSQGAVKIKKIVKN
ncbi:leucine-rich repeat protein [Marinilabilia sp.]|uniref:leucine-rich repeat protein n=1 Tax=Marinilabilia sp. TaxID=2021252 RepID=UPI0025C28D02|nr:leucine-rich repeat protein [Marinilabilia sp.]